MKFMLNDLKQRGIVRVTLGVEPAEETNKKIYAHYGFNEYINRQRKYIPMEQSLMWIITEKTYNSIHK